MLKRWGVSYEVAAAALETRAEKIRIPITYPSISLLDCLQAFERSTGLDGLTGLEWIVKSFEDAIEENRRLQEELKHNNNLHRFYSIEIARAIGDQREKRSTGEPAKSDAEEIRRQILEICRLKEEVRILKEKANG